MVELTTEQYRYYQNLEYEIEKLRNKISLLNKQNEDNYNKYTEELKRNIELQNKINDFLKLFYDV